MVLLRGVFSIPCSHGSLTLRIGFVTSTHKEVVPFHVVSDLQPNLTLSFVLGVDPSDF